MNSPNDRQNPNQPPANHQSSPSHPENQDYPTTYRSGQVPEPERGQPTSKQPAKTQRVTIADKFIQMVYFLVGALELLLGLRFLLRLTAANQDNTFANFILGLSEPFVRPFSTLFVSPTFNGNRHILDVNLLVAMVSYLVLMVLVVWLIRILTNR